MDVELYVYDLSRGLARQLSRAFLGIQVDAVYHTALVFGGIEYFFGAGVQTCYPGSTHHGPPMEVVPMGRTQLELGIILEYVESLKEIFTAESYDLFLHNCNNFTNDLAMFLLGKAIPQHITSLPQTVLNTPFGQMLKPQLENAMRNITQAPVPPSSIPAASKSATKTVSASAPPLKGSRPNSVHPHRRLKLHALQGLYDKPVLYAHVPLLDKVIAKLGAVGREKEVIELRTFVETRTTSEAASAALPDLPSIAALVVSSLKRMSPTDVFPLIDLLRLALVDPRVSGYFAEEEISTSTVLSILAHINHLGDDCPYRLRIVTLQLSCNLFSSPLYPPRLVGDSPLSSVLIQLVVSSLLDKEDELVRAPAELLAFNIAAFNHRNRLEYEADVLAENSQVELAAGLLEAIDRESSSDNLGRLVLALGLLSYACPTEGELHDLLSAMGAADVVRGRAGFLKDQSSLVDEVVAVVS